MAGAAKVCPVVTHAVSASSSGARSFAAACRAESVRAEPLVAKPPWLAEARVTTPRMGGCQHERLPGDPAVRP